MAGMQFVSAGASNDEQQKTRRAIRRHVMLGKNRGRTPKNPKQSKIPGAGILTSDQTEHSDGQIQSRVPRTVCSDLSLLVFADKVDLHLRNVTLRLCITMSEHVYMLEPCVAFDNSNDDVVCLSPLMHDSLYMNIMVFGAAAFIDIAFQQATSQPWRNRHDNGLQHYGQALRLLRERLAAVDNRSPVLKSQLHDAAITAVFVFAMHALLLENFSLARCHLLALSKLVSMREGGLNAFRGRIKQMIEIMRCDLSVSIATGEAPLLLKENMGVPASEISFQDESVSLHRSVTIDDLELCQIRDCLGSFFSLLNKASMRRSKLPDALLRDTIFSVIYRLAYMPCVPGSCNELIHLTMLSFCARTVLQWPLVRLPFTWLKSASQRSIDRTMRKDLVVMDSKTRLWVLIIYGITFTPLNPSEDEQLRQWLEVVGKQFDLANWDAVREAMRGFLWVDVVCNQATRRLLDKCRRGMLGL